MGRVRSVIDTIQEHDSPERFCKLGAAVRFGEPRFIDDHTVGLDGARLTARAWIVATGSSPSPPPVEGIADVPYWTNETVFSQTELPGHLLILGGGPIGVEMAQAFRRLGSKVTVVEYADQLLGPEDPDIASILRNRLEAAFRDVDRALAEGETEGKIKVLISSSGALLGCQIAGHHAGELIHEWVAAINGGVKLSTLAGAIHAYPTLAEISKKAAGSYYSEKLFGDRTKKILRFLFDPKGRACTPEEEVSG